MALCPAISVKQAYHCMAPRRFLILHTPVLIVSMFVAGRLIHSPISLLSYSYCWLCSLSLKIGGGIVLLLLNRGERLINSLGLAWINTGLRSISIEFGAAYWAPCIFNGVY